MTTEDIRACLGGKQPKDAEALARQLVQAKKLTKYQAQALYQGKSKGLIFGEYVVLDKLGQGGMGLVLKAQHRRMKRFVAVKMIAGVALKSPDSVKRFYRDVRKAKNCNRSILVSSTDALIQGETHETVIALVGPLVLLSWLVTGGPDAGGAPKRPAQKAPQAVAPAARAHTAKKLART